MHYKKVVSLLIILPSFTLQADENKTISEPRKSYGLSFNNGCANYVAVFKCMTACKSLAYQIYRIDFSCKCTCHEMKTSTILPFFKWRTIGFTKTVPKTQSPRLYDVVGTLSPVPEEITTLLPTIDMCEGRYPPLIDDTYANIPVSGNTTEAKTVTNNTDAAKSGKVPDSPAGKPAPADSSNSDTSAEKMPAPKR